MLTFKSLHDRAVVSFTGAVDWSSICDLVDLVRHAGREPLPHLHRAGHRLAGRLGGGARPLPSPLRGAVPSGGCVPREAGAAAGPSVMREA